MDLFWKEFSTFLLIHFFLRLGFDSNWGLFFVVIFVVILSIGFASDVLGDKIILMISREGHVED